MARWYARFDADSEPALDSTNTTDGYFTQLRVSNDSASGARLRDGLLASRSLLSNDVYADLDAQNKDGSKGIYFPRDNSTINVPTNVTWPTAYTSSIEGMKTPTINAYGVADSINYSKRPNEVYSYTSSFVTESSPLDPIDVSYQTYFSASAAVRAVVESIKTAGGAPTTPYTRTGNDPNKTLLSVWHNPTIDYIAWDDFTPGPISSLVTHSLGPVAMVGCPPTMSLGNPVNIDLEIFVRVGVNPQYVYPNDGNQDAEIGFTVVLYETGSSTLVARLQLGGPQDTSPYANGGPLQIGDYTTGTGPLGNRGTSNSTWEWNSSGGYTGELTWTIPLKDGEYDLYSYAIIHDVIVTSNTSQGQCSTYPTQDGPLGGRCNQLSFKIAAGEPS